MGLQGHDTSDARLDHPVSSGFHPVSSAGSASASASISDSGRASRRSCLAHSARTAGGCRSSPPPRRSAFPASVRRAGRGDHRTRTAAPRWPCPVSNPPALPARPRPRPGVHAPRGHGLRWRACSVLACCISRTLSSSRNPASRIVMSSSSRVSLRASAEFGPRFEIAASSSSRLSSRSNSPVSRWACRASVSCPAYGAWRSMSASRAETNACRSRSFT